MRLRDLDAHFVYDAQADGGCRMSNSDSVDGMQGISFQCPKCGEEKQRGEEDGRGFIRGAHYIRVFFANPTNTAVAPVEADANPRWTMSGEWLDTLTLSPSINCDIPWKDAQGVEHPSSCKFHGFVRNGDAS